MDSRLFSTSWSEMRGKLRGRYKELSQEDLTLISGEEEQLLERIENRLGKSRREVETILTEL